MEFQSLIDELSDPYFVLGDFNAHISLWGGSHYDVQGCLTEQFLCSFDACLLNRKEPTYYSIANNTYSVSRPQHKISITLAST